MESGNAPSTGRLSGTISALEVQARDQERVNLYLDGRFAFGLSAKMVADTGLKKGDHLSADRISELLQGEARERALQQAFNYLSFRPRSKQEIERYLVQKGHAPETIEEILRKLADYHYVDDQVFAVGWVENRQRFRPTGPHLLRAELRQKGVDHALADQAIADVMDDEKALALEAATKRADSLRAVDYPEFSRKLGGFLSRRGFSGDVVWDVVRELWRGQRGERAEIEE